MKPTGMNVGFQIIRPSAAEDAIWAAVEAAICANVTPEQFKREAAQAWEHHLVEQARDATEALTGVRPRGW